MKNFLPFLIDFIEFFTCLNPIACLLHRLVLKFVDGENDFRYECEMVICDKLNLYFVENNFCVF